MARPIFSIGVVVLARTPSTVEMILSVTLPTQPSGSVTGVPRVGASPAGALGRGAPGGGTLPIGDAMARTLPSVLVRQVLAIVAAAALASLGAVVLGEYPLQGLTVVVGFPLYGLAVTELALAIGRRLALPTAAAVAAAVALGLTWALWISFGHFRNDARPPGLSWVMVGVAFVAALAWGRSGRRAGGAKTDGEQHPTPGVVEPRSPGGPKQIADQEVLP